MASNNDTSFGYIQATSENGQSYVVGYPTGQIPAAVNEDAVLSAKRAFDANVNWPADGKYHATSDGINMETGITSYQIGKSSSPFYDYFLEIHVRETYNYHFTDQEGDTYNLNTFVTGLHVVRFNSKKPTIVHVKGS
ncbi:hypothetical protein H2198_006386 [Neophaeococcomyces mojaviensis]|uniref:Uncharacterized protein n=1 Tax=Neophaeococcomyces mojaviensis TaxID=3383035 RepID=A0ACC3A325_9EURO|nr:hypothetical protein H2198_006386 [Knufia sp. JES_112]